MFDRIKKLREESRAFDSSPEKPETDEDGRALVRLRVRNDDGFLSPFYAEGCPVISGETAAFLEQSVKHVRPENKVRFVISGNCVEETERPLYQKAIENYYRQEFSETRDQIRRNTAAGTVMTAIAVLVFLLAITLTALSAATLILDVLDVVAWVFLWEAVDLFFLQRPILRIKQLRNLQIATAKVDFVA